jgi:hypothetical protein
MCDQAGLKGEICGLTAIRTKCRFVTDVLEQVDLDAANLFLDKYVLRAQSLIYLILRRSDDVATSPAFPHRSIHLSLPTDTRYMLKSD